jgi:hypothetical protein
LGQPVVYKGFKLEWHAKKNDLPKRIWLYRVSSADFPPSVISRLLQLGNLSPSNATKSPNPAFNKPGDLIYRSSGRELGVFPSAGTIEYSDPKADDMASAEDVPSADKAVSLGLHWIKVLGIHQSDLANEPGSSRVQAYHEQRTAVISRPGQNDVTNTHLQGVLFARAIDGIPVFGRGTRGGCLIEFGNHLQVAHISLLWRKLSRTQRIRVNTPEQILNSIREGKSVWQSSTDDQSLDWGNVTKMTITEAKPYYYGETAFIPEDMILPFAVLSAQIETPTATNLIHVLCPIALDTESERVRGN